MDICICKGFRIFDVSVSVAQLDARPTGNQVADSTPARSAIFFHGELIMKYFLRPFSSFRRFKKGICQFLAKECAQRLTASSTKPAQ